MSRRRKEQIEPAVTLLSPDELEIAHAEWDAESHRIVELYQHARRNSDQPRAHALWALWQSMKCQEQAYFAEQAELQKAADEALPPKRQRRGIVKTAPTT
jgi:thiamine kinase-like enzyme